MAKYLATFTDRIGDVEINGFKTMTDKEIDSFESAASSINWGFSFPVGEENVYFTNGEDLLTRVEYKEINSVQYKTLGEIFDGKFGVFVDEDFLQTLVETDSVEDDEDDEDWDDYSGDFDRHNDFDENEDY